MIPWRSNTPLQLHKKASSHFFHTPLQALLHTNMTHFFVAANRDTTVLTHKSFSYANSGYNTRSARKKLLHGSESESGGTPAEVPGEEDRLVPHMIIMSGADARDKHACCVCVHARAHCLFFSALALV